ncbi:MAG: hypothetical protein WBG86_04030, partial [Polyangiales bacterium]
ELRGLARRTTAPSLLIAELTASLVALDRLRTEPPLDPRVHIALQGVSQNLTALLESEGLQLALAGAPMEERDRWHRDQPLLRVAHKARDARFTRALEAIDRAPDRAS